MRGVVGSVLVAVLLGVFTVAAQLPPEIMADRYLVQADRLMKEKDFKAALEAMEKIVALQKEHDLKLPGEFHFKYAQIALSAGLLEAVIEAVNRYLVAEGRSGASYRQALELLDEAEKKQAELLEEAEKKQAELLDQAEKKQAEKKKAQEQVDEHLAEALRLIAEKKYKDTVDLVNKTIDLRKEHDLTLPDEFHFVFARAALSVSRFKLAKDSANQYLSVAGPSGQFYGEVQELLEEARAAILPEMAVIPGGSFRMGCVSGKSCRDDEKPVHEVSVASFELSKYEVTFEKYDRFVAATGRRSPEDSDWGRERRPVINVSWEDAVAYAEWLSTQTGQRYRLPTEAEWEYAARAGSTTKYSWGNKIGRNRANCDGCGSQWDDEKTAPVGSFSPNSWGLHDMHGNLWEWVQDCWNDSYQGAPTDGSAWTSGDCEKRVLRGGSWDYVPESLRAAFRNWFTTGKRYNFNGFRVARTLTP